MKNALTFLLNAVKLTALHSPPQATQDTKYQENRQRNQNIQGIHQLTLDKRSAFTTTHKELQAIPRPAAHAGKYPKAAKGTHTKL